MPADLPDWMTASAQPAVHLGTYAAAANGSTDITLTPPAGTHGIGVVCADFSGNVTLIQLTSAAAGNWLWTPPSGVNSPMDGELVVLPCVIDPQYDPQVVLRVHNAYPATAVNLDIFALLDVEALVTSSSNPVSTITAFVIGSLLNTGQVSIATSSPATLIKAANGFRYSITVKNTDASNPVFLGGTSGVTAATGHELAAGDAITFTNYASALYAIATGAAVTVTYAEESQ